MYCVKCGVELENTEKQCPLCKTVAYHPDILVPDAEPLYPNNKAAKKKNSFIWVQGILTAAFILPIVIVILCDMQFNPGITWSGYVVGALMLAYVAFVLPTWFRKPNPVIFVPCTFAAIIVYLLYINLVTGGNWFLSFALPVGGCIALIVTAVVALMKYVPRGVLYIFGGAFIALGGHALFIEFLLDLTFDIAFIGWSLYPLVALVIIGGLLIFLGICRPARESMERRFFI